MAIRVYCMPMTGVSMIEVMLSSNPPKAAIMVPKPKQRAKTLLMRTPMSSAASASWAAALMAFPVRVLIRKT